MNPLIIGETNFRNTKQKFGILPNDRLRHCYILGASGCGKSTLLENLIIQDMKAGRGVAIIDPHGQTAETVLANVPKWRTNSTLVFDPSDTRFPISFNPIDSVPENQKHLVVSGVMSVFEKLFFNGSNFASQAPQLTHILRHALYAVMDTDSPSLLSVKNILVDDNYRNQVIRQIKDPVIKDFWTNEFPYRILKRRDDPLASVLNKLGMFLSIKMLRNILDNSKSSFDCRKIMDNKMIFIANLSKGKIGHDVSSLLGAMLITKFYLAAMSRVDTPESEREHFGIFVDEFQNFSTSSFSSILSEARKYRISITMANQYIRQLDEPVRDAVFGNCGTIINFRAGVDDAEFLEKFYDKKFSINDITSLPKYNIYLRLMIDNLTSKPFSATTLPPIEIKNSNVENIIKQSRLRYAKRI